MSAGWLIAVLPLATLTNTLVNLATWTRGTPGGPSPGRVSALVPARDEAACIERCVRALLAEPVHEVVVCDDGSTDATADIVAALAREDPRVRLLSGTELPTGWIGKPHACHQLALAARGDVFLYVDADVRLAPGALGRIASLLRSADVVTAVPRQETVTLAERLVVPLLHLVYSSWLPLALVLRSRDPRVLAANGQVLALRREHYDALGGFASVRDRVVDDVAFCRRAKEEGFRVCFADGDALATCRMYRSSAEVWSGFSKNLYEGVGASPANLTAALGLHVAAFLVPWLALPFALKWGAVGVCANVLQRSLLAWRHHQSPLSVALHPVSIVALVAIGVNSWAWHARGAIVWRGRRYNPQAEREA